MEKEITEETFLELYEETKEEGLEGRFLSFIELAPRLERLKRYWTVKEVGRSFLDIPVHAIEMGTGETRILAWSQMHGNETTTTRGLLDLLKLFELHKEDKAVKDILKSCRLLIIPMLNPDGAARYTRENANKIDLNRDAHDKKEVETRILFKCYEEFRPDYCLNLHDQRTIFGAGDNTSPATLSFLSPAMDQERRVNPSRARGMKIIAGINERLQKVIPGQVGRFDDSFNINCTGDTFQSLGVTTILFEAGHFQEDYNRLQTRKFFTFSLFVALHLISSGKFERFSTQEYFDIPENQKNFYDVILRNAQVKGELKDVGLQFREIVKSREVTFVPVVQAIADSLEHFGHRTIDCEGGEITLAGGEAPGENDIVDAIMLNNKKLSIKTH